MIVCHLGLNIIHGDESVSIKDSPNGVSLSDVNYRDFSKDLKLEYHAGIVKGEDSVGNDMTLNNVYTAYYSLNYFGKRLIAIATAQLVEKLPFEGNTDSYTKVFIDHDDLLRVKWFHQTAKVNWSVSLYEAKSDTGIEYDSSKSYLKYFLVGFYDPDESNYLFNPDGRIIYYDDKPSLHEYTTTKTAAEFFQIVPGNDGGLIKLQNIPAINFGDLTDNSGATFVVSIHDNETSFNFKTDTLDQGALQAPRLYSRNYNITYNYNDSEGPTHTMEGSNQQTYASSPNVVEINNNLKRVGYTFLGWNNETDNHIVEGQLPTTFKNTIDADAYGDKVFKAYWLQYGEANIEFIDKTTNNELLETKNVKGQHDSLITSVYTTKDQDIKYYTDRGYKLISDGFTENPKFQSGEVKTVQIVLEHTYTEVNKETYEKDKCLNDACSVKQPEKGC